MKTGEFRTFTPDPRLYKDHDEELGEAMVGEVLFNDPPNPPPPNAGSDESLRMLRVGRVAIRVGSRGSVPV